MINDWRHYTLPVCSQSRARERKNTLNYHSIEAKAASVSFVTQTTLFPALGSHQMTNDKPFLFPLLLIDFTSHNKCLSLSYMEINTSEMRGRRRLIYNTKSSNISSIFTSQKHFFKLSISICITNMYKYNQVEAIVITLDHKLSFLFAHFSGEET